MSNIIETIQIHGFDVEIFCDEFAENPRESGLSSTFCTAHRHITGDVSLEKWGRYDCRAHMAETIEEAYQCHLREQGLTFRDIIDLDVYCYQHGGTVLATRPFGCPWDSGKIGFIYEIRAEIRKEFGVNRISKNLRQIVEQRMRTEIEEFNMYLNGEVYGCRIPVSDNECYGFYGSDHRVSGLIEFAQTEIEEYVKRQRHKHFAKLKQLIRNGVNSIYRSPCPF